MAVTCREAADTFDALSARLEEFKQHAMTIEEKEVVNAACYWVAAQVYVIPDLPKAQAEELASAKLFKAVERLEATYQAKANKDASDDNADD